MTDRRKILVWSALMGLVVGATVARLAGYVPAKVAAFGFENTPMGRWQLIAAVVPWLLFSLYWEVAAKNAAATKKSESNGSRGVHVVLANLALVLEIVQIRGLARFLTVSLRSVGAGVAVEGMGLFVAIWARRHLGRNWSGEITIKMEHQLIRTGPYKLLRHPIYTGILGMYAGTALVTGTWLALAGLAMAVFAYWRKIRLEETNLSVGFGADYDAYRRETWALVPGIF
jgi:protein-S-isoprenylcysteine O-methyltransferase Ste14